MKKGVCFAVAALTAAMAPLGACSNQGGNQSTTSPSSGAPPGTERMTTQLKGADGSQVGTATIDFTNGYATVTVEAGPNHVLSPGFHGLRIHSVGRCEASSAATGGSTGDFNSAGSVYQASGHTGYPASGDLTALQVRPDGSAKLVTTTSSFTAADLRNSSGTALVIQQDVDYLSNGAASDSGKRLACGVIAAASATTTSSTTPTTTVTETIVTTTVVPPASTSTSTSTSTVTLTSGPTTTYPSTTSPTTTVTTRPGG
ncbi:superoxide dismutase family protein [Mycobacterium sp. 852002-51163_SCH5372311]|uniref:superoxide dismutase family protein n=1 Tax=Mycobacterium sp. 852002-51163_SCH5372311 TaxID=1834097 RepID=UPI0009ED1CAE